MDLGQNRWRIGPLDTKRIREMMKMVMLDSHVRTPNNRAIRRISAMPAKADRMIQTGAGIAIPDDLTIAIIAQQTIAAMAIHTSMPTMDDVDGSEARKRKESAFMDFKDAVVELG